MGLIALKCEQCGGNIALEEDGTGKCPYCGCEYIDSRPITNNYYINYGADTANQLASTADKYLKSNNYDKVSELADKLLESYPSDYRGLYYKLAVITGNFTFKLSVDVLCDAIQLYENMFTILPEAERERVCMPLIAVFKKSAKFLKMPNMIKSIIFGILTLGVIGGGGFGLVYLWIDFITSKKAIFSYVIFIILNILILVAVAVLLGITGGPFAVARGKISMAKQIEDMNKDNYLGK